MSRFLGSRFRSEGVGDVTESAPQAGAFEGVEAEVSVEGDGVLVEGVDDHGTGTELPASPHATVEVVGPEEPRRHPAPVPGVR